jgi:hypothetical protein
MRKLNSKSRVFLTGILLVALSMTVISCLRIFRFEAPSEVETNSVFEVRLVLDDKKVYGIDEETGAIIYHTMHYDCWGYIGVQLPIGWTIDADELEYEFYPMQDRKEGDGHTDTDYHTGTFEYDAGYVDNCFGNEYLADGYYVTGFSTMQTESECMDSIVVKLKIHTDGQLGDKILTFYVQENGNEEIFNRDETTQKPIYPLDKDRDAQGNWTILKGPKPAARTENDNGENCTRFLELTVKQGQEQGIQTVTKDASCNVSALGNGQLLVNLSDSKKVGATVKVYNMRGQIATTRILTQTSHVISGLTPGIYSLAIEKDGVRSIKKAIVK